MIKNLNFNPGDVINFDDRKYVVIKNYGQSGLVKEYIENGILINNFSWEYKGKDCILTNIKVDDSYIKNAEYQFNILFDN